jgi:SAM-dependent methyltransferase
MSSDWRDRLEAFFEHRARLIPERPTLEDLCYIAGRNPRLWTDETLLTDLRTNLLDLMGIDQNSSVLEVGSAAGFLAQLVAPHVGKYVGVDLAEAPLAVAKRLGLKNAEFQRAQGEHLHFSDGQFDSAFCYDVFSNFPTFEAGEPIISEMLRVVRPGGRILIGSIPDCEKIDELQTLAKNLAAGLEHRVEPEVERKPLRTLRRDWIKSDRVTRIASFLGLGRFPVRPIEVKPEVICYYFDRRDFLALGHRLDVETKILDIHPLNPYVGTRFNAVFISR